MAGRKQDAVWLYFDKTVTPGKPGCRAACKKCGKHMQGLVKRMKQHQNDCSVDANVPEDTQQDATDTIIPGPSTPNHRAVTPAPIVSTPTTSRKRVGSPMSSTRVKLFKQDTTLDSYIMQTTKAEKELLDLQLARYIYATNTSFSAVEHRELKKWAEMMRPGYHLPSRFDVGGKLLDSVHESSLGDCRDQIQGKTVCMSLDGWSNIRMEPVVKLNNTFVF